VGVPAADPHDLLPPPTHDRVDRYVQRWVAGTNGRLYIPLINRLPRYPIPRWPAPPASPPGRRLLDVGCAWGRWMVAAGRAGYVPIGLDVKLDALQAARRVLRHHGLRGHVVAADLAALPFRDAAVDLVFSYSVLQHVPRARAAACVRDVRRVLRPGGTALLEFPLRHGLVNWRHALRRTAPDDDAGSWHVRYYGWRELRRWFAAEFGDARLEVDCYLGIGVRPEDLDLMPLRYRPLVLVSEGLRRAAGRVRPLAWVSDSVFVRARRPGTLPPPAPPPADLDRNLPGLLPLLRCPVSGGPLEPGPGARTLLSRAAGLAFPVVDDVPVLLPDQATAL
jgi:SAM-dependent methyltransferase/uncharacterized protein YbaR (Trm112 family)